MRSLLVLPLLAASAMAQETFRVSVDSSAAQSNLSSYQPSISADGAIVAFASAATNLVANDTNGTSDVFVHDRVTGITERVSVDSAGIEANSASFVSALSADGRIVAFESDANNLVANDTNNDWDVFVHDRVTGVTEMVSVDSAGVQGNAWSMRPALSADGNVVAFLSGASNLVAGDTNVAADVFVHDRTTGITTRVTVNSAGVQANRESQEPAISADGNVVGFSSMATNLVPSDHNNHLDVFVHDRTTGGTSRVSVSSSGGEGNQESWQPSLSADGMVVAYNSFANNLVSGDANGHTDVFVRDRATQVTEIVSFGAGGVQGDGESDTPTISGDGRVVVFASDADNLVSGDTNQKRDVFVRDRALATTARVSVDSAGAEANDLSARPTLCADGTIAAFSGPATNLVANDTNGAEDVFVHEICLTAASWTNYGAGFPGTNGVPSFTSQANPVIGTTLTLDVGNSLGSATAGLLFIGLARANLSSIWGGDLLVLPLITQTIAISATGASFTGSLPDDLHLCGVAVDLQAIEADPGAAHGVSFTAGLELVIGH